MFQQINRTSFPPVSHTMVWDGNCGFCSYWITVWKRIVGDSVLFITYQSISNQAFRDIDRIHFTTAVRLIETNGDVHSGPGAAFRSLALVAKYTWLSRWYFKSKLFRESMDSLYQLVADHRGIFYKGTLFLFGADPANLKLYWLLILGLLLFIMCMAINFPWKG